MKCACRYHCSPLCAHPYGWFCVRPSLVLSSVNIIIFMSGTSAPIWFIYAAQSRSLHSMACQDTCLWESWMWHRVWDSVGIETTMLCWSLILNWCTSRYRVPQWASTPQVYSRNNKVYTMILSYLIWWSQAIIDVATISSLTTLTNAQHCAVSTLCGLVVSQLLCCSATLM